MRDHFTPKEVVNVIDEALRLIATPETFVQGEWKCPLIERDEKGKALLDAQLKPIPKVNKQGEPVYGYCVEGAINQAVLNLFGKERAVKVGAISVDPYNEERIGFDLSDAACKLSVNVTAHKLFRDELRELYGFYFSETEDDAASHSFARALNDDSKVDKETAYKRVKRILQRRRKEALSEI